MSTFFVRRTGSPSPPTLLLLLSSLLLLLAQTATASAAAAVRQATPNNNNNNNNDPVLRARATSTSSAAAAQNTSTYIWETSYIIEDADAVVRFAAKHDVNRIYLYANKSTPATYYQTFIAACTAKEIAVDALGGDPTWARNSTRDDINAFLEWIETYNANATAAQRFSAIHVDIEPYLLDDWDTDNSTLIAGWKTAITLIADVAHNQSLSAMSTLPYWLHNYANPTNANQTLDEFILSQVDGAVVMAYRNNATKILAAADAILAAGADYGKPIWVGVETLSSSEGADVSFYGMSESDLEDALEDVESRGEAEHTEFAGVAVHDYKGWLAISEGGSSARLRRAVWGGAAAFWWVVFLVM